MNKKENKDMIKYKDNFIIRFFKYVRSLFRKEEKIQITEEQEKNKNQAQEKNLKDNKNFKDNIIIKQNEDELKILELQKQYKAGNILEEDMSEEEHTKLIELYKKQNKQLHEKIMIKRDKMRKRLNELKTS